MPSPVGHVLGGLAAVFTTDIATHRRTPDRLLLTCAALAAVPDIDLVVRQYHRMATHSVAAVAVVFIVAAAVTGRVTRASGASVRQAPRGVEGFSSREAVGRWRTASLCALAYASHLLLDWLGADHHAPRGIDALWPFSDRWFISGLGLFRETARLHLFSWETTLQNTQTVLQEIAILLPIAAGLWLVREKAAPRLAPEIARRDHAAK